MTFLEKDLEDLIFESDREKLEDRGLYIQGIVKRQLRIGNYGIADLVSFNRTTDCIDGKNVINTLDITIYELKKDKITTDTFFQALNYVKGISDYLEQRGFNQYFSFDIVLIGKYFCSNSSMIYLTDLIFNSGGYPSGALEHVSIYTYNYGIEGLVFKDYSGYKLSNDGFNIKGRNQNV